MGKFLKAYHLNLQLFAEGAGGDGGASGVGASDGAQAAVAAQPSGSNSQQNAAEAAGDGAQVAAVQNGQEVDYDAEFGRMIEGDYKDAFDKRVNRIVRDRVKGMNAKVRGYDEASPILDTLAVRYGVKPGDYAALKNAIEADRSYRDAKAEEMGVTPEVYDELESLRARAAADDRAKEDAARAAQYEAWQAQVKEARAAYPNFNLSRMMENEQFKGIVNAGVDMKTAYEIVNRDRLMQTTVRRTAEAASRKTEENVVNRIKTNGMRPNENGTGSQSPATVKVDVSKLSDDQIKEYLRRAKNGEKITF